MKTPLIIKAIKFATDKHQGQFRRVSGEDYVTHPILVSELIRKYVSKSSRNIENLIISALLHDTIEDTNTNFQEISNKFNPLVAGLVLELTSDELGIKRFGKNDYLKRKMIGMSNLALTVKLVDRLSNIMDCPTDKYCKNTINLLSYISQNRRLKKIHKIIIEDIKEVILSN